MASPTLTGVNSVVFLENTVNLVAQIIDADVSLTDVDEDFNGATMVVRGLLAEDTVSINSQGNGAGQISFNSGTGEISYGGVVFGIASGGSAGTSLTVTFDADATAAAIEALIQNLTYFNSSHTPTASRTLSMIIHDAAGNYVIGAPGFQNHTGATNPMDGEDIGNWANPTLADVDGDGLLDIVVGDETGVVQYFRNTGTATAPAFTEITGGANPFNGLSVSALSAPVLADLDDDNDLDLVLAQYNGQTKYFENTGSNVAPAYTERTGGANPFNGFYSGVHDAYALGDIDGDGDLDLVVGNYAGNLTYYENTGNAAAPAFTNRTGLLNPFDGITAGTLTAPTLADLDGDGDLDLTLGEMFGIPLYFENTGSTLAPTFVARTGTDNPFNSFDSGYAAHPAAGDLDGDGAIDLIVGERFGTFFFLQNVRVAVTVDVTAQADPTGGADTIPGTIYDDTINGLGGVDTINGLDGDDTLDGGDGNDTLNGGNGADYLRGGIGADRLNGGAGDDTYVVDNTGDIPSETGGSGTDTVISSVNFTIGAGIENLILGTQGRAINGTGNSLANVLTGNSFANTLNGLAGSDTLNGGGGDDILNGGDDDDTLDGGTQNDTLNGGAGTDTLLGGAGHDTLDGGTGADAMTGGLGNDSYVVDDAGDTVIEAAAGGTDSISASVSFDIADNVESITLTGSGDIQSFGNALANTMTGNTGANHLVGGAGNDILNGMDGDDSMLGEEGNDTLIGGIGADALSGEEGSDRLTGGAGADIFMFWDTDMRRSALGQAAWEDTITDIDFADGDRIDLSAIDANVLTLGFDDPFVFVSKLTGVAGQAAMSFSGGRTFVRFDVDGDGKADLVLVLNGDQRASMTDVNATAADGGWYL